MRIRSEILVAVLALILLLSGCGYEPAVKGPSDYDSVVVIGIDGGKTLGLCVQNPSESQ